MGFSESVRTVFIEKYVTFSGRASRSEYWWSILAFSIYCAVAAAIVFTVGGIDEARTGEPPIVAWILMGIFGLIYLAFILPLIAVIVRRLHDRDMSGWWYLGFILLSIIPIVGGLAQIALIVIMCLKGTEGENRFGPDPLNEGVNAEVFA